MKNRRFRYISFLAVAVMLPVTGVVFAQGQDQMRYHRDAEIDNNAHPSEQPYSPWVDQNIPQRPFFGDTHLHTAQSFDAVSFGTMLGPEEAYRFARGKKSPHQPAYEASSVDRWTFWWLLITLRTWAP